MRRLPADVDSVYQRIKPAIQQRLLEFQHVPKEEWFYEFCFCLCTPQSRAEHAMVVVDILKQTAFFERGYDPTYVLANNAHYIRFHNMKARRILNLREQWGDLYSAINRESDPIELRNLLVRRVRGYGLKEASHVLRNIGFRNLAILDRHILRMLKYCGVVEKRQGISTPVEYMFVEQQALNYANDVRIPLDELDLLFWYINTGKILK